MGYYNALISKVNGNIHLNKLVLSILETLDGLMDSFAPVAGIVKHGLSVREIFWIVSRVGQKSV